MNYKQRYYFSLIMLQVILIFIVLFSINGLITIASAVTTESSYDYYTSPTAMILSLSAALAIGVSALASAWVIKTVATAAISALTEREGAFGKLIIVVAMGEAIAIYGLIIAVLLWLKIPSPPG